MKTFQIIRFAFLITALAGLVGCEDPRDALSGYDLDWTHTSYIEHPLAKALTDDVQKFIESKKIPKRDISDITYGKDTSGRHVAVVTQEIPASQGEETNVYILYYDKDSARTGVRKFHCRRSC